MMHGTFNGVRLKQIISRKILTTEAGATLTSFRVGGHVPQLEEILRLDIPALLILSNEQIEGRIVHFDADLHRGYEITIEVKMESGNQTHEHS